MIGALSFQKWIRGVEWDKSWWINNWNGHPCSHTHVEQSISGRLFSNMKRRILFICSTQQQKVEHAKLAPGSFLEKGTSPDVQKLFVV